MWRTWYALSLVLVLHPSDNTALASIEDEITHRIELTFSSSALICAPTIIGDFIVLQESASADSVIVGAQPMFLSPAILPISPNFGYSGPWEVWYISELTMADLLAELLASPFISEALELPVESEVLGEISSSTFPVKIPGSHFYDASQKGFHSLIAGEDTHPEDPSTWVGPFLTDWDLDLPQAWAITKGDSNVVVAIVDTGVNYMHEELQGQMFVSDDPPGDDNNDGCPGDCGVDDNNDGFVDPDANGFEPDNQAELLVDDGSAEGVPENVMGTWVSGSGDTVTLAHPGRSCPASCGNWLT